MAGIRGGRRAGLRLRAYALLSRVLFPKSYLGRVLLAAFVGTHIPLLVQALPVLAVALAATLVGSVVTLSALYVLLAPPSAASIALRAYLERDALPELPTDIDDEGGRLLGDVQGTIVRLDGVNPLAPGALQGGRPDRRLQPEGLRGALGRRGGQGGARRGSASAGGRRPRQAQGDKRPSRPRLGRRGPQTPGDHHRAQHPRERLAGEVGRGRVLVVAFWEAGSPSAAEGILARVARTTSDGTRRGRPRTKPERMVRVSVDVVRSDHKYLRDVAYDTETDAMSVMRTLLRRMKSDADLEDLIR